MNRQFFSQKFYIQLSICRNQHEFFMDRDRRRHGGTIWTHSSLTRKGQVKTRSNMNRSGFILGKIDSSIIDRWGTVRWWNENLASHHYLCVSLNRSTLHAIHRVIREGFLWNRWCWSDPPLNAQTSIQFFIKSIRSLNGNSDTTMQVQVQSYERQKYSI